jgi:hypothetical protein
MQRSKSVPITYVDFNLSGGNNKLYEKYIKYKTKYNESKNKH